jgi:hypothetical protein
MAGIVIDSIATIVGLSIGKRKRWLPLIYEDKEVVNVRSDPLIKEAGRNGLGTREGRADLPLRDRRAYFLRVRPPAFRGRFE